MKQFSNYETAKKNAGYEASVQLPVGAYVCKIMATRYTEPKEGSSGKIDIQFDVVEGEYKNFFRTQYENNSNEDKKWKGKTTIWEPRDDGSKEDEWTKNTFARWTNAIEDSNAGYTWDWDESKWKDKLVGIVFGTTGSVIEGREIAYTEARFPIAVEKARKGEFRPPKFKARNGYKGNRNANTGDENDFMDVPTGEAEELPW